MQNKEGLELSETALRILEKEEAIDRDFLKLTGEKLERHGMKMGPASRLADFANECKESKKRLFSSYKTQKDLREVSAK